MGTQEFQNKLMSLQSNLLNFAYMLTSNRDNAYDLLQDTTLKALDTKASMLTTPTSKAGFSPSCAIFLSTTIVA